MRGRLFTILSVVSLLLCIATCARWVRSLRYYGDIWSIGPQHRFEFTSVQGSISAAFTCDTPVLRKPSDIARPYGWFSHEGKLDPDSHPRIGGRQSPNTWGFGMFFLTTKGPPPAGWWRFGGRRLLLVYFPHWLVMIAFGLLSLPGIFRFVSQRGRVDAGGCASCGYDLRATPDRCPECGAVPAGAGK